MTWPKMFLLVPTHVEMRVGKVLFTISLELALYALKMTFKRSLSLSHIKFAILSLTNIENLPCARNSGFQHK